MMLPTDFLDHGVLGVSLLVLLIAIGVLTRVLVWTREILRLVMDLVVTRIETDTTALMRQSERLYGSREDNN